MENTELRTMFGEGYMQRHGVSIWSTLIQWTIIGIILVVLVASLAKRGGK